jgi:hypothetical protein
MYLLVFHGRLKQIPIFLFVDETVLGQVLVDLLVKESRQSVIKKTKVEGRLHGKDHTLGKYPYIIIYHETLQPNG